MLFVRIMHNTSGDKISGWILRFSLFNQWLNILVNNIRIELFLYKIK